MIRHCISLALLLIPGLSTLAHAADDYKLGPDSQVQEGVPRGVVTKAAFSASKVFPGTVRDYWIYVPTQYNKDQPTPVMIFQDGGGFVSEKGGTRATIVLDNLIHKKEIPVMIGIFVNPGVIPAPDGSTAAAKADDKTPGKAHPRFNRSYEYDSPTDLYARFLLDELLPEVAKQYNLSTKPTDRGLCGSSSGGICAFTAAWERPDAFSRVISFIGSFTNLRGGNDYPSLIRKTEPKPIRVFLQDGSNDLDIYSGSWWISNQDMAAALKYAGYEYTFVPGDGGHNGKHAGSILPEALRYIWKDHPRPPAAGQMAGVDQRNVMSILTAGQGWEVVVEGQKFTEGPTADAQGNVYFNASGAIGIIAPDGKMTTFLEDTCGADGMMMGPDNTLYVCAPKTSQIVVYDLKDKSKKVLASDQPSVNDLVVMHTGAVYATDHKSKQVWYISPTGEKKVVDTGLQFPNGVILTPDQSQLIVADMNGAGCYLFTIKKDGSLTNKQLYYYAQIPPHKSTSGADGLAMDKAGNLYVATHLGIQVFDQAGRVTAIIPGPVPGRRPSNVDFGGPDNSYLYITNGDKVFRRKTKAQGVLFFQGPLLTPAPRL